MAAAARPRSRPVTLEVLRIDLLHIAKIDQIEHIFRARLFFQLLISGGQHDKDLMHDFNAAEPEFQLRPSATWFLHQLHFPSAVALDIAERKVTKMGADDLHLILRVDGSFLQHFDLHDFPYDTQCLEVQLSSRTSARDQNYCHKAAIKIIATKLRRRSGTHTKVRFDCRCRLRQ